MRFLQPQLPNAAHQWQAVPARPAATVSALAVLRHWHRPTSVTGAVYQGTRELIPESPRRRPSLLRRWSFHHGWLDAIYHRTVVLPTQVLARFLAAVDRYVVDRAVEAVAVVGVIVSHLVAWFDRQWIDGSVNSLAGGVSQLGRLARAGQTGQVQTYYVVTLLALMVLLYWLLL